MCPEHNDERWYDDGDDDDDDGEGDTTTTTGTKAVAQQAGKGKKGTAAQTGTLGPGGVRLPLSLGGGLKVLRLGRVEWLNRAFHSEKYIWPVSYAARRKARTPAAGGRDEVWHTMEVLEVGGLPLFRVTPEGGAAVEGPTATAAWAALFGNATASAAAGGKAANSAKDAAAAAARAAGRSGPLAFGLQHPRIRALLQQLPGAERLERLLAWEGGERPEVPALVSAVWGFVLLGLVRVM